jgi:carbonic anhydrase
VSPAGLLADEAASMSDDAFEASHPSALALYCSDGRFTRAVEALLRKLGHERIDTMTLPGGPALLCTTGANLLEVDTVSRAAQFLIQAHQIVRVVLIAHEGCGYYRYRYPRAPATQIEKHQHEHLALAAKTLTRRHPQVSVQGYYARVADGRVGFTETSLAAVERGARGAGSPRP